MTLRVGQAVMFDSRHGSVGRIAQQDRDRYHVIWSYGLDAYGEQVHATSRWLESSMLVAIDEELLKAFEETRFNTNSRERARLRTLMSEARGQ